MSKINLAFTSSPAMLKKHLLSLDGDGFGICTWSARVSRWNFGPGELIFLLQSCVHFFGKIWNWYFHRDSLISLYRYSYFLMILSPVCLIFWFYQWEFQDPKLEVLYHMFGHIWYLQSIGSWNGQGSSGDTQLTSAWPGTLGIPGIYIFPSQKITGLLTI